MFSFPNQFFDASMVIVLPGTSLVTTAPCAFALGSNIAQIVLKDLALPFEPVRMFAHPVVSMEIVICVKKLAIL